MCPASNYFELLRILPLHVEFSGLLELLLLWDFVIWVFLLTSIAQVFLNAGCQAKLRSSFDIFCLIYLQFSPFP